MGSVRNGSAGYSSVEGGPAGSGSVSSSSVGSGPARDVLARGGQVGHGPAADDGRVRDGGRVGDGPARGDMGDYGSVGRGSARHSAGPQRQAYPWILLRLAGAGLLAATAAIHLDLYLTGYRTIPTIGWLFLLQVISGFVLAALVLVTPARLAASRLVAAGGALFALGTLGGYLLTVQFGLFGFREVRTTAGIVAGVIEVAAFAVLAAYALRPGLQPAAGSGGRGRGDLMAWLGTGAVSVVALALLGGAVAGAGGLAATGSGSPVAHASGSTAGGGLRVTTIGGAKVLTNAAGRTLYWFAPDTPTKSVCNGSCAVYWPPVSGPLTAGPGVTGHLGTITRSGGATQETYDGHPLYTYVGDPGPGQAHGNNLNLNGGLWHEITVTGS